MLPEIIPNWHPVFVHFTIALFTVSTIFLVVGNFLNLKYKETVLNVAYINLWAGCLFTIATVLAGFYAYNTVAHDEPSHMAMTNHKNWAIPTAISFWILGIWSIKLYKHNDKTNKIFMILMIMAFSILTVTGWKGGEAVYRYGLGVISLPNTNSHKHGSNELDTQHENMQMKEEEAISKDQDHGTHNHNSNTEEKSNSLPNVHMDVKIDHGSPEYNH